MQIDGNHRSSNGSSPANSIRTKGDVSSRRVCEPRRLRPRRVLARGEHSRRLTAYDDFLGEPRPTKRVRGDTRRAAVEVLPVRGLRTTPGSRSSIFRGTERNKRRGFHNLYVFNQPTPARNSRCRMNELARPRTRDRAEPRTREVYSFGVDGKCCTAFAAISRVGRDDDAAIRGYQRPEVLAHIQAIRSYLESPSPMIPNGIVVAFDARVRFESRAADERRPSQNGNARDPARRRGAGRAGSSTASSARRRSETRGSRRSRSSSTRSSPRTSPSSGRSSSSSTRPSRSRRG